MTRYLLVKMSSFKLLGVRKKTFFTHCFLLKKPKKHYRDYNKLISDLKLEFSMLKKKSNKKIILRPQLSRGNSRLFDTHRHKGKLWCSTITITMPSPFTNCPQLSRGNSARISERSRCFPKSPINNTNHPSDHHHASLKNACQDVVNNIIDSSAPTDREASL